MMVTRMADWLDHSTLVEIDIGSKPPSYHHSSLFFLHLSEPCFKSCRVDVQASNLVIKPTVGHLRA